MMAAGLSLAGLSVIVGYKSLHQSTAPAASAHPVSVSTTELALAGAARDIAVGETITPSLVRTAAGDIGHNPTIATPGEVIGKVAIRAIRAGTLIDRTMIDTRTKLAIRVPVGMRAMSIDTTAEIAVAGLIRPGDSVDVQAVYPGEDAIGGVRGTGRSHAKTLLQLVPVLAVGELVLGTNAAKASNNNNDSALTSAARTVTLALTPEQVSILSLAKHVGTLSLSLRNPDDKDLAAGDALADATLAAPHAAPRVGPGHSARHRVHAKAGSPVQIVIGGHSDLTR
jgi:pilus assembly protein CpaB